MYFSSIQNLTFSQLLNGVLGCLGYNMIVELVLCTQELCEKGAGGTFRVETLPSKRLSIVCERS